MNKLTCPKCQGEIFHPIEVGTVSCYDANRPFIFDPGISITFTPTKRVFVCITCGFTQDGTEEEEPIDKSPMYVVSDSVSRASKELRSVGIEVSDKDLQKLQGNAMVIQPDGTAVLRAPIFETIKNSAPGDLIGYDIKFLNTN